jgi:hypothetical protein
MVPFLSSSTFVSANLYQQLHYLQTSTFSKGHLLSKVDEMDILVVDRGHKKKLYLGMNIF